MRPTPGRYADIRKAGHHGGNAVDLLDDLYWTVSQYFPEYWLGTIASAAFGVFAGAWINSRILRYMAQK